MATSNDESIMRYPSPPQGPYYYQPQSTRPSTAESSAEGGRMAQHVRYADQDRGPVKPRVEEEATHRVGGGRSGRRTTTGTSTGTGLNLSIWKSKKDKRNGKKKSKPAPDDSSDNDDSAPETEKKPVEVVYRGQAGGSRSGRGLSIPLPLPRNSDKSKSKPKGKGISRTSGSDDGSETGSVLSIGLGVPAEQWERERGVAPSANRTFNSSTLHALKSLPVRSPPSLDTASQFGSSSMMSGSGSGLSTWSEEEEEGNGDMRSDARGSIRGSPDRASDETFRRQPPPHYSTIHSPSADPRAYSGATKRGRARPLPLRPESPTSPPFSNFPSSPQPLSPPSASSRGWPTPPRSAYAHSISSGSSSSMPSTPPMHPLDLYTRRGRSKSPGPTQGLGLTTHSPHSPQMVPWDASGLSTRSEGSIHTPGGGFEIPGNNNNGEDAGVVTGVVNGVDAAGRPYQYTYQYQSASGAPPNPGELIAALAPPQPYYAQHGQRPSSPTTSLRSYGNMYPHANMQTPEGMHSHRYTQRSQPGSPYPSSPPPTSPPIQFFPPPPPQSSQAPPQPVIDHKPQQRPTKRLVISGIGAPGADDLHFDFERALDEMHLVGSGDDRSDGGRDDGNDSDVDPAIGKKGDRQPGSQQRNQGGAEGRGNTGSLGDQSAKEKEREEAVIQWCRGFGDVLEVRRRGQGCLMVEFLKEGVVDSICRVQQVYIKGAGKVEVGWC